MALISLGLIAVAVIAALVSWPQLDPTERTVDRLLRARARRAETPSAYANLVDSSAAATALADAARSETGTADPTPRWKKPYLVAKRSTAATVAVVWRPSRDHAGWPTATLFRLVRRGKSDRRNWRVVDAIPLPAGQKVPAPAAAPRAQ